MTDNTFSQDGRIKKKAHFSTVYKRAIKVDTRYFIFYYAPKTLEDRSFAFIASRRVGNAVIRNRGRRRIKEVVRGYQHHLNKKWDMVFIVKQTLLNAKLNLIERELKEVCEDLNLWLD